VVAPSRSRLELASAFATAATRYWLGVFPQVGRELHHWHARAQAIPDPVLRRHALVTQREERGNLEGAAAFAVLVPRVHRAEVVRAAVAFQATYDYVDTLAEQPCADPSANGRQLHLALLSALDPEIEHPDYYEFNSGDSDNGYIRNLIDTCRAAFGGLPSYPRVADGAIRAAERMVAYQSLNHGGGGEQHEALERWACAATPAGSGLMWWETAAGAASSLAVFALIAAAGQPRLSAAETAALEGAYFPWIGALHVLLDSLVDYGADVESGHHSLVEHYASVEEAGARLSAIAARAMQATELVPASIQHAMILAAMTSFYLSAPLAWTPGASAVSRQILDAVGILASPTMVVLRARRAARRLLSAMAPRRLAAERS
jgi:tetraprenyl-beta-curcumene synthase